MHDYVVHMKQSPFPRSRTDISHRCFVRTRNICSPTIQRTEKRSFASVIDSGYGLPEFHPFFVTHTRKLRFPIPDLPPLPHYSVIFALLACSFPTSCIFHFFITRIIHQALDSLSAYKPLGPEGIPSIVLIMCLWVVPSFTSPFLSYSESFCLFDSLERLWFSSAPKRGEPSDPNGYRPVPLASVISKVFYVVVSNHPTTTVSIYSDSDFIDGIPVATFEKPQRSTKSCPVPQKTEFIMKVFWRRCQLSGYPQLSYHGKNVSSVQVNALLFQLFPKSARLPQDLVLTPIVILLFVNCFLSTISSPIHSFVDEHILRCFLPDHICRYENTASMVRNVPSVYLQVIIINLIPAIAGTITSRLMLLKSFFPCLKHHFF